MAEQPTRRRPWDLPRDLTPEQRRSRRTWIEHYLVELDRRYRSLDEGAPADYIPALALADPSLFGVAVLGQQGQHLRCGDADVEFTIQSISKVVLYGLALETWGRDVVHERAGVEPSGDRFNAITFDDDDNRAFNPMVNAGALAITDLLGGDTVDERLQAMLDAFERYLGHPVEVDQTGYRSEVATAHRNRAITHLLVSRGIVSERVEEIVELYTMQCSIVVTAIDLATIAATLANAGVNPVTGERALAAWAVRDVLSVMLTCGMYDYSGEWVYRVGLPAKSGVGGGVLAVLPGIGGLGVYSPPLDKFGTSVRGVKVCEDLAEELGMHLFEPSPPWTREP